MLLCLDEIGGVQDVWVGIYWLWLQDWTVSYYPRLSNRRLSSVLTPNQIFCIMSTTYSHYYSLSYTHSQDAACSSYLHGTYILLGEQRTQIKNSKDVSASAGNRTLTLWTTTCERCLQSCRNLYACACVSMRVRARVCARLSPENLW